MNKCHTPITWVNDQAPAINDTHLNQMDTELDNIDDRDIAMEGDVEAQAENAEAWAVGERGGDPVDPTDPTYENNAKHYAGEASDSATAASTSAGAAEDSAEDAEAWAVGERSGTPVTSGDPTYENNSKHYAQQSASSAGASADSAEDAEALANGTRGGVPVGPSDPAYENNAKYWRDQAHSIVGDKVDSFNGRTGIVVPQAGDYDLAGLSDVNISSPQDGDAVVYDSVSQKYVNRQVGSGLLPHIIISAPTGATVVLTKGLISVTATETSSGVYEANVPEYGTYTITGTLGGDTATTTLLVDDVKVYNTSLSFTVQLAFHYSENDSSPASVSYPSGYYNSNFTDPFYVDLSTGIPHYGDWDFTDPNLSWLLPKSCMLKYDGTVDYYLDENDETKKADGTASDVADPNYGGNAMMEWGQNGRKIYWKIVPDGDGKGFTFVVANAEVDSDFHAWNHYDCDGNLTDHFYTPKYYGSSDGTRLRSISGASNYVSHSGTDEITQAKANNTTAKVEWYTEVYADRLLLQMLCTLISKSTDSQSKFGQGYANLKTSALAPGTMNGRGLFYGESTGDYGVKVFGMEHPWGNLWRRYAGLINDHGTIKFKLTYGTQDGSSASAYNTDGTGYITNGTSSATSGLISHMDISTKAITPNTLSGSLTTYYCDEAAIFNNTTGYVYFGGALTSQLYCGIFQTNLGAAVSHTANVLGSAISCRPLAS